MNFQRGDDVRLYKFPVVMVILLLALLPAVLYAETVHEGHGGATVPLSQKQNVSTPAAGQTGTLPATEKTASVGSHDGHGQAPAATNVSSSDSHNQHGSVAGSQKSSKDHSSGGHGGESRPNVLQPVKNSIVAGFATFNGLIVIAALLMKKKFGQGV